MEPAPAHRRPNNTLANAAILIAVIGLIALNVWYVLQRDGLSKPPTTNAEAPAFSLPAFNVEGTQTMDLASLRGKVVVVDFWATWCDACRAGMPALEAFHRDADPERVAVLAINNDGGPPRAVQRDVRAFLKRNGYTFPVLMDLNGEVFHQYGIAQIPQTMIIDPKGMIRVIHTGPIRKDQLQRHVDELLANAD